MAMAVSAPLAVGKTAVAATAISYRATVLSVGDGDTLRVSTRQGLPARSHLGQLTTAHGES
jgi:endonuclease YncB( thermonuclease family)